MTPNFSVPILGYDRNAEREDASPPARTDLLLSYRIDGVNARPIALPAESPLAAFANPAVFSSGPASSL
jgi:hypothetical protein